MNKSLFLIMGMMVGLMGLGANGAEFLFSPSGDRDSVLPLRPVLLPSNEKASYGNFPALAKSRPSPPIPYSFPGPQKHDGCPSAKVGSEFYCTFVASE